MIIKYLYYDMKMVNITKEENVDASSVRKLKDYNDLVLLRWNNMINKTSLAILQNIDSEVALLIAKSRNISELEALRIFLNS